MSVDDKRRCIQPDHPDISIQRQCELVGLSRATWYYQASPAQETPENLNLMCLIDEQYTKTPFYGSRRIKAWLNVQGYDVNRKRVQRLMRLMGIQGVGPKPGTSMRNREHKVYPYLLNGVNIGRPNHVWSTDITYCPMPQGFMYLVAIIDWYSRYVISWELSNTLDADFCIEALKRALEHGKPDIFNTDQGCQFTCRDFLAPLQDRDIRISMDGKGRALDNVFVERLWRSVKYEWLYTHEFQTVPELHNGMSDYFDFYNTERLHQSLDYRTPQAIHFA
jgi:putative transposase